MTMKEPIISVSGMRGIVGESLTPEVAVRYAAAFAATLPPGPIVLTYDGRPSGMMFIYAILKALSACGRDVIDCGEQSTPTAAVLVRHYKAAGGIQISASHNPIEWNGLKLISAAGRVIPASAGEEVLRQYAKDVRSEAPHVHGGKITHSDELPIAHIGLVNAIVDLDRIRDRKFRVLIHPNGSAGRLMDGFLLGEFGCQNLWTDLSYEGNAHFEHPPEPTAENLAGVLPKVVKNNCDIGFCQDPDADRLAVIDEKGRYIGEEYTLAICIDHILRQKPGPVVTNCSTSRMTEDLAKKYGVPFYRSAVGEANVVDAMLKHGAVLGGEGNGGVIDPRVVLVRDSFTAMALILDAMAARKIPVSALADELPRYEICKTKITLPKEKLSAGLAAIEKHFKDARADRLDGLRLNWADKWLLVRGSNTEPIVRAIAEAPTAAEAERLCREATVALNRA
jgi:phosphomannomutase